MIVKEIAFYGSEKQGVIFLYSWKAAQALEQPFDLAEEYHPLLVLIRERRDLEIQGGAGWGEGYTSL